MRALAAQLADAVAVRRRAQRAAADDLAQVLRLQRFDRGLDDRKGQAEPVGDLHAGELAREVQRLDDELDDQVQAQTSLLQRSVAPAGQ